MGVNGLEELLTEAEAAAFISEKIGGKGISVYALRRWRYDGEGPRHTKIARFIRYTPSALIEWLTEQAVNNERI